MHECHESIDLWYLWKNEVFYLLNYTCVYHKDPGYCIHVRLNAKKKMTFEDDDLIMRILFIEIQIQKESLDRRGLVQPMCKQIGNSNYKTKYRQQWTYTMED